MKTLENLNNEVKTIVAVKTIKGTSFIGVRNYTSSKDEISNQTFLVGINYAKLLNNDLETLKAFDINPLMKKYDKEVVVKAYAELLASLIKRTASEEEKELLRAVNDTTIKRSDAQSDAYNNISKGLKEKEGVLYIQGLVVRKTILKEGVYPTKKTQVKTLVKNEIKKSCELRELKYRNFKLGNLEELNVQGVTI